MLSMVSFLSFGAWQYWETTLFGFVLFFAFRNINNLIYSIIVF